MDYNNPILFVLSGPNGAGKSTHAQSLLPKELNGVPAFDRDKVRTEFEKQLKDSNIGNDEVLKRAESMMEDQLAKEANKAISTKTHFVLETPLSHPDYWLYIDRFEKQGYKIQLCYLCLDRISDCMHRVCQRTRQGGHYVKPEIIKGVYEKNLEFINNYKDTFSSIKLYDGMRIPTLLAMISGNTVQYTSEHALEKKWVIEGLPTIAEKIKQCSQEKKDTLKKAKRRGLKKGIN